MVLHAAKHEAVPRVPKFSFQLDVRQPPAQVIGAMVDFSERRPDIWPNLTARLYQVHNLGPGIADVTEGTALRRRGRVGARYLRVDRLSRPLGGHRRKTFRPGGTVEFRVEPHGDNSRIINTDDRRSKALLGRILGAMLQLSGGAPINRTFRHVYGAPSR